MKLKEFIKKYKLINKQYDFVKQLYSDLKNYIKYSTDCEIDFIEEVGRRMEMIEEFSIDLKIQGEQ